MFNDTFTAGFEFRLAAAMGGTFLRFPNHPVPVGTCRLVARFMESVARQNSSLPMPAVHQIGAAR